MDKKRSCIYFQLNHWYKHRSLIPHFYNAIQWRHTSLLTQYEILQITTAPSWHVWCQNKGACHPTTIAGANILVPCHIVKSLQLIWGWGTRRFHLRVPHPQMSCKYLPSRWGTRIVVPVMTIRVTCPTDLYGDTTFTIAFPHYKIAVLRNGISCSQNYSWKCCIH